MAKWEHQTSRSQRKGKGAAGEKNTVSARRRRAETAKNEQKVRIFGRNLLFSVVQIEGFWRSTSPIVKAPPFMFRSEQRGGGFLRWNSPDTFMVVSQQRRGRW